MEESAEKGYSRRAVMGKSLGVKLDYLRSAARTKHLGRGGPRDNRGASRQLNVARSGIRWTFLGSRMWKRKSFE